jgi:hypothetical protein
MAIHAVLHESHFNLRSSILATNEELKKNLQRKESEMKILHGGWITYHRLFCHLFYYYYNFFSVVFCVSSNLIYPHI